MTEEIAHRATDNERFDVQDWRAAHSWLRGYSDAQLGKPFDPSVTYDAAAYRRGADSARAQ